MSQMSHVKKVREIFESHNNPVLESLDISPHVRLRNHNKDNSSIHTFKRAQTLIDFRRSSNDLSHGENLNGSQKEQRHSREGEEKQDSAERENESQSRRFERQSSSNSDSSTYRSVRRSPAFRRADDLKKKPVTPPKIVKLTRQSPIAKSVVKKELFDELQYIATSETIKKALRSPLPAGPAPPKPPRTFGASPQNSPSHEINIASEFEKREDPKEQNQVQSPTPISAIQFELEKKLQVKPKTLLKKKIEEKKTLGALFQCIIPTCSIDPIYKEQIKREAHRREEEKIYMEPFAHLDKEFNSNDNNFSSNLSSTSVTTTNSPPPAKTEELHYMCTNLNIFDQTNNNINNNNHQHKSDSRRSSLDEENNYYSTNSSEVDESYDKINALMDVMYDEKHRDSIIMLDETSGSSTETKNPANRVSRSLTEKRKNYVRRMTQTITAKEINAASFGSLHKLPSAASIISQFQKIIDSNSPQQKSFKRDEANLFKMILLVGYDVTNKKGYIKSTYPKNEKALPMVEQFIYPTSKNPCDLMTRENQNFTLILTDEYGNHLYGYCRQIIPEGFENCLPLTYCIISSIHASGFYFNILKEIEERHGHPENQFNYMLRNLQRQEIPSNGKSLYVKLLESPSPKKVPDISRKPDFNIHRLNKRLSLESPEWLKAEASKSFDPSPINRSLTECTKKLDEITIRRPHDVRMENSELNVLYESTTSDLLIMIFGTLLIERKVILLGSNVSQISSCMSALYSILYPFQWHHTIISIVPEQLVELLQAPFPFFAGVLRSTVNGHHVDIEDGIVVDLDSKCLLKKCGDEATLIPETLKKSLMYSLKIVEAMEKGKKLINVLIAEAFLQFFVKLFANLNCNTFDKNKFIEAHSDQATKYFLEWFFETVMFKDFMTRRKEHEKQRESGQVSSSNYFDLFNAKVLEKSATLTNQQQRKNFEMLIKTTKHKTKRNFRDRIKDFLNN